MAAANSDPAFNPHEPRSTQSQLLEAAADVLREGRLDQARELYLAALAPLAPAVSNLALIAAAREEVEEALVLSRVACTLCPREPAYWTAHGRMLLAAGRHEAAAKALEHALSLAGSEPEAHALLGLCYQAEGHLDAAARRFERAIELAPDCALAWDGLGALRMQQGRLTEAESAFRASLLLCATDGCIWNNLGVILHDQGRIAEGEVAFRRAAEVDPEVEDVETNRLFYANCSPGLAPREIAALHREWGERFAVRFSARRSPHANPPVPDRRLRIGYVSADFNEHPVAFFFKPLLLSHDRQNFDVICFANGGPVDHVTAALRERADGWHDIGPITDDAVDALVRCEGIDILVDLAGHSSGGRMPLFARQPAPIQVTYLGYPNTTGLPSIQYRITDAFADPPGRTEAWHVEQLVRPFESFLCYNPPPACPPVTEPPFRREGHMTFGCFNHFRKLSPKTVALWRCVLHAVPDSKLLLKNKLVADEACRKRLRGWFTEHGIADDRVEIASFTPSLEEHLRCYDHVDIALDTFPYNGTTTTCEALWMGVPVVTLAGSDHRSRVGLSILTNAGLSGLVADNVDGFIASAARLAADKDQLAALRSTLRDRLRASSLLDAPGFTRALERAYRAMWHDWCRARRGETPC